MTPEQKAKHDEVMKLVDDFVDGQVKHWEFSYSPPDIQKSALSDAVAQLCAKPDSAEQVPDDPMDWRLPCDVTVGHGTIGKGCKLRTLVARMQVLYDMAMENPNRLGAAEMQKGPPFPKDDWWKDKAQEFSVGAAPLNPAQQAPTDISKRFRNWNRSDVATIVASDLYAAADEIERYYSGMLNWKKTAEQKDMSISALQSQLSASQEENANFKNFHRSLCERFGYVHDEIDWRRDQVSLEEHINAKLVQLQEENASLSAEVKALTDIKDAFEHAFADEAAVALKNVRLKALLPLKHCAAGRDGECAHKQCPQLCDGEPVKSGRHCPLDNHEDE
ncbi:MAG: hypothetical protein V4447_10500 [Pseudomonadota bacterium]